MGPETALLEVLGPAWLKPKAHSQTPDSCVEHFTQCEVTRHTGTHAEPQMGESWVDMASEETTGAEDGLVANL